MKTIISKNATSISIRKHFGENMELEILGTTGRGDSRLILYRARTGQEVIESNGDPIWDTDSDFQSAREQIMGGQ